ncbi:MAG: hypothetical protein K9I95_14520 [Flavobacteriaceae bacterium]|nr:hypothetical protein [Flavobacteriaceae bacterium]
MKATKIFNILLFCILVLSCSKDDSNKLFDDSDGAYIRFFLLVNSNNQVLEYPEISGGLVAVSLYEKNNVRTLKIPVAISSTKITDATTATFNSSIVGDIDLTITPQSTLTFSPNKLVDTIYVSINNRWDFSKLQQLKLSLTSVSNEKISIGIPNVLEPNNELTINFSEPSFQYTLEKNRIEINGDSGEEVFFKVNFPLGYFENEINENDIFTFLNGFDYTLSKEKQDDTSITYKIKLNENIQNDDVFYQTVINLIDNNGYLATGNKTLQVVKPIKTQRDISVNTASHFYNLADQFYRTYGETWNDFNKDGICQWTSYNAFTYPIVVSADNPNAILYDDKGTTDPSDDIYHDAFKIGFKTPNTITTTTNSFNLKRWFSNESTSGINSPGFDVNPALEFFPENGNSTTKGTVLVIPQYITIAGTNGNSYSIAISGDGTYEEYSPGLFELKFQLKVTNDILFGGTITAEYLLYNNNSYPDPQDLTTSNCVTEYTL